MLIVSDSEFCCLGEMLIRRAVPRLVCQFVSEGTGLLLLLTECTGTQGVQGMASLTNWSDCIRRFIQVLLSERLNKLHGRVAGSQIRYSKESSWSVVTRLLFEQWSWMEGITVPSSPSCVSFQMAKCLLSLRDVFWSWFSETEEIKAALWLQKWKTKQNTNTPLKSPNKGCWQTFEWEGFLLPDNSNSDSSGQQMHQKRVCNLTKFCELIELADWLQGFWNLY